MNTLERAIEIAARAHAGQVDKAGQSHILHVLRVIMSPTLSDNKQRSVAALHDVVEDCPAWPLERLRRDFRGRDALTHRDREDCESFIRRASDRARGEVHDLRQGRPTCLSPLMSSTRSGVSSGLRPNLTPRSFALANLLHSAPSRSVDPASRMRSSNPSRPSASLTP